MSRRLRIWLANMCYRMAYRLYGGPFDITIRGTQAFLDQVKQIREDEPVNG